MEDLVQSSSSLEHEMPPSSQSPPPPPKRKVGGWNAIKYILGNESFEKLASMSLIANITVYLQTRYNMEGVFNVTVTTVWSGSSNITSLMGAIIADTYLGRFRTLFFGSIFSLLGMTGMTLTAGLPKLTPPRCNGDTSCPQAEKWQLGFLFASLGFLSIGSGGIRPCNIAFGADQFDTTTAKGRSQLESFFNWWYFFFTIALVVALTAVVYIQTNVSWVIGFIIPTSCLFLSISIFLIGRSTYICKKPRGSIFTNMIKVVIAACRKRQLTTKPDSQYSFYDPPMDESELHLKIAHTDRFRFLDKAAMISDLSELDDQGLAKNTWRLCSLQQVEQLKCLIAIGPVWVSGIACFIPMDQQNAFGILQAIQINKSVGPKFQVPPGWMGLTSMIALSIWIYIYERIYVPKAKKLAGKDKRLTMPQRIKTGIVMSILCMLVAGFVEKKRRESALRNGTFASPITIAALLPQFVLSGLIEAFAAVAIMEFYTTGMPESMRTVAGAVFFLSLSISSYISSLLINIIHHVSGKNGKTPWLGGHDLNQNRLDYYYFIIAGLAVVNFIYFNFYASRYAVSHHYDGSTEVKVENSNFHHSSIRPKDIMQDEEKGSDLHDSH
ncbi:protein NRT1/ PTR FAMILY 2.8 [Ricinus communis]|uniref:Nitrate transporter, putative n=1 Tax=Ricinus communis TaxID=3988 RepID=B9R935_RICCO|nr:protein NRT1/ PTR FAMILY 2.8 [Ricinus communis]EEF52112.1 nitrate transporter, putative [Ricinus communis]|eukprot:XP_002511510.1 protein NRT1/ PTR FAMILY 2.8 [Ricinus communis]